MFLQVGEDTLSCCKEPTEENFDKVIFRGRNLKDSHGFLFSSLIKHKNLIL